MKALAPDREGFLPYGHLRVAGLVGWGAISAQAQLQGEPAPRPNTRPFEHLSDLDAISEQLGRALG